MAVQGFRKIVLLIIGVDKRTVGARLIGALAKILEFPKQVSMVVAVVKIV